MAITIIAADVNSIQGCWISPIATAFERGRSSLAIDLRIGPDDGVDRR